MGLVININAVWGYMGQVLVFDTWSGASPFRPKWWEWSKAPDGNLIGPCQWVRFRNPYAGHYDLSGFGVSAPRAEDYKNLVDKDGAVAVQGGSTLGMALFRRASGFDGDWILYLLLMTGGDAPHIPDINQPLPKMMDGPLSMGSGWGYFGKKGDPNRNRRSPEGIWDIDYHAESWFVGDQAPDRRSLVDPYEDYRFEPPDKKKIRPTNPARRR